MIEFSKDVKLEGQSLSKGKYGLFIAYDPAECIVIFSKTSDAWGSFFYDEKDDALRVKVKPLQADKTVESLKYEFTNQTANSAVVVLSWEKLSIPFKIEVDYLKQQFDAFVAEAQNPKGFTSQGLNIAAAWSLQNNYELEKALEWSNIATGTAFPGDPGSFTALTTKALILEKLKRTPEATALVKSMLAMGNMNQLQQLGRQLLANKNASLAMEVFRHNHEKHPGQFISLSGMARGLSANAAYPEALEYADKALPLAPNPAAKEAVAAMIEKLKQGKDIN